MKQWYALNVPLYSYVSVPEYTFKRFALIKSKLGFKCDIIISFIPLSLLHELVSTHLSIIVLRNMEKNSM